MKHDFYLCTSGKMVSMKIWELFEKIRVFQTSDVGQEGGPKSHLGRTSLMDDPKGDLVLLNANLPLW